MVAGQTPACLLARSGVKLPLRAQQPSRVLKPISRRFQKARAGAGATADQIALAAGADALRGPIVRAEDGANVAGCDCISVRGCLQVTRRARLRPGRRSKPLPKTLRRSAELRRSWGESPADRKRAGSTAIESGVTYGFGLDTAAGKRAAKVNLASAIAVRSAIGWALQPN